MVGTEDIPVENMLEKFAIRAECAISKARTGILSLPHFNVETPIFMPVGTKGCMKGVLPEQLEALNVQILLGNTYHLGLKPGPELLTKVGGLHRFMNWNRAMLTDSGGFQMVSLLKLTEITEEGVLFESTYSLQDDEVATTDGADSLRNRRKRIKKSTITVAIETPQDEVAAASNDHSKTKPKDMILLTPEKSMEIQNAIGADIMMQLDDVVSSTTTGPRVTEAMQRSIRWLERCKKAHARPSEQYLFPITQGGLDMDLRKECIDGMRKTDSVGIAIGGLSGGEEKSAFWRVVSFSTDHLTKTKPRYVMGVGYAEDLVVCCALGADMFDCVFPTRTARFGCALVDQGQLNLKNKMYQKDFAPIDDSCDCLTCRTYTRSYLHHIVTDITVAARLISIHNIAYQMNLMRRIREAIKEERFPEFVRTFMVRRYGETGTPQWAVDALASVGINVPHAAATAKRSEELPEESVAEHENKKRKANQDET